ncbi:erythromycin esterase family protein [Goodfellowiella coeruleoviolacea]|nr:erythromycin esterase family protein [Goodfellowiella coeruleoviolacea]
MPAVAPLRDIGRPLDDPASLGRAVDELLTARTEPPVLLALGEPTHGIEAFPVLRNDILRHLVDRGFRSIVLETDTFAASVVDDYVCGAAAEIDTVLATGFSHGFGTVPGNRELVEWLRAHNAGRAPRDRVRFHGFDAPMEFSGAPSPRRALCSVHDYLPSALRPGSARDLDALLGEDADWTNEAAMFDPAASIGDSERARALRIVADDLASALRRAAPSLRRAHPTGYDHALAHARTAQGLLRYHAAMASPAPDRVATLFSLRTEMMAENLLAIVAREQRRGPILAFAHNAHLRGGRSLMPAGDEEANWGSAGALVELTLGERYLFVATDASPDSDPGTLQHALAEATTRRALFPAPALRAALAPAIGTGKPIARGHLPLTPADVDAADAVIFVTDTDGKQHRYW